MSQPTYNIGMVGYKFMGRAHGHAYIDIPAFFPDVPRPVRKVICGRDRHGLEKAAAEFGWERATTDWRELVNSPDVDIVDICAPGHLHSEVALAAARAGKHVICEKPLANSVDEAKDMCLAVETAGVKHCVIFNYRYLPAVQLAKRIIQSGGLGRIFHVRAQFLQDWIIDPEFPIVWRLRSEEAGSGALGDLGAHLIDLSRFLVGEFQSVASAQETFIRRRPLAATSSGLVGMGLRTERGDVTVDDAVVFLARLSGGVLGVFEASRLAAGHRCTNAFEINGSLGSVRFDFERMNELQVYLVGDPADLQGFRTINCNDAAHPYAGRWWPAGHGIGYEVGFVHQIADFLSGLAGAESQAPTFHDGLRCQEVLDAVARSAGSSVWTNVV